MIGRLLGIKMCRGEHLGDYWRQWHRQDWRPPGRQLYVVVQDALRHASALSHGADAEGVLVLWVGDVE